jgi:hypothetical protein
MEHPGTLFLDIDGTLLYHTGNYEWQVHGTPKNVVPIWLLNGVREFIEKYALLNYKIIITTGRKESDREKTVQLLSDHHIQYDMLIMGLPRGPRIVVNDKKPDGTEDMAIAISPERNVGLCEYL